MSAYEIPLSAEAQEFQISLAGVVYSVYLYWNSQNSTWNIDIADSQGNPLLRGIPLVANVDLLGPYAYMQFGGKLIVQTDNDPNAAPTSDNLGTASHLYFVTQ